MYIYKITNKLNNKAYIGQTTKSIQIRFIRHCWHSEVKKNMPIDLAIHKYGKENFLLEEICKCDSLKDLNEKEIYYVKFFNTISPSGYNLRAGGENALLSEETKIKIGLSNLGRKASFETKKKLSDSHKGFIVSEETKKKLSLINKGKRSSLLCNQRASVVNSKSYKFISPSGEIKEVKGLNKFCKDNNLSPSCMCNVAKGLEKQHKGWKVA